MLLSVLFSTVYTTTAFLQRQRVLKHLGFLNQQRCFHSFKKKQNTNEIYSQFGNSILTVDHRSYGYQDTPSSKWLRDLNSLPADDPIQKTRKILDNDEEFWRIFRIVGFSQDLLQIACRNRIALCDNYKRKQLKSCFDLEFIPSQSDLNHCLSRLVEQEKNFTGDNLFVPNFYLEILKGKLFRLAKQTKTSSELAFTLNPEKRIMPAYSFNDLITFLNTVKHHLGPTSLELTKLLLTPVINGVSFQVFYRNGFFESACTTELGHQSVDLTDLIRTLSNIPKLLPGQKEDMTLFGTLYVNQQDFQLLNVTRQRSGQTPLPDTKSLVAHAILNSEEPNKTLGLKLKCNFRSITFGSKTPEVETNWATRVKIKDLGFPIISSTYIKHCKFEDLLFTVEKAKELEYPFEVSALEISIDDTLEKKNFPYEVCSYKLFPKLHETVVHKIDFKVLSNGNVAAVIHTDPIQATARFISTFWIGNQTDFNKMDIRIGDRILVSTCQKTPSQILKSYKNSGVRSVQFPKNCPKCEAVLTENTASDGKVVACCPAHLSCKDDSIEDIVHFVSAQGVHVPSLTKDVIVQLKEKLIIANIMDLFSLSIEDFAFLANVSRETFEKILEEIKIARSTTLARFIYALKIPKITPLLAQDLAYSAGTIDRLIQLSGKELLAGCTYNDKNSIDQVVTFFSDKKRNSEIMALLNPNAVNIFPLNEDIMALCFKTIYTEKDYEKIIQKIKKCNEDYSITDFEFDMLVKTVKKIEEEHPKWVLPKLLEKTKRQSIPDPMPSISKTYSIEEMKLFIEKSKLFKNGIGIEPKIDGIALSLIYENGKLINIFSKHDDKNMKELDLNYAVKIEKIPKNLKKKFSGIVRGELFMTDGNFYKINNELNQAGLEQYKDSLSAVISSLHTRNIASSNLFDAMSFFGYHVAAEDLQQMTRSKLYLYLEELGFEYDFKEKPFNIFLDVQKAIRYISDASARRREFKTAIDGMVLKPIEQSHQDALYAYKFPLEKRQATLKKVHFNLTQSGDISVLAEVEPVQFSSGRVLGFVPLSPRVLQNLSEGDKINVSCSSGMNLTISDIIREGEKTGGNHIQIPTTCPSCEQTLGVKASGALHCTNVDCFGPRDMALRYFANFMNFGNKETVKKIIELGLISTPFDFYKISIEDLMGKSELMHQKIQNLLFNIEESKNSSMLKFLTALHIPGVGFNARKRIFQTTRNFEELLMLTAQDIMNMRIRESVARKMEEYLQKNKNDLQFIKQLFTKKRKIIEDIKKRSTDPSQIQKMFFMRRFDIQKNLESLKKTLEDNMTNNSNDLVFLKSVLDDNDLLRLKMERVIPDSRKKTSKFLLEMEKYIDSLNDPK
jgi:DNA ligase (NAD+)